MHYNLTKSCFTHC